MKGGSKPVKTIEIRLSKHRNEESVNDRRSVNVPKIKMKNRLKELKQKELWVLFLTLINTRNMFSVSSNFSVWYFKNYPYIKHIDL
jgi:hypothetical protein